MFFRKCVALGAGAAALALCVACNTAKLNALAEQKVMAGSLLFVPSVAINPAMFLDGGLRLPDGGSVGDGGLGDAGTITVPSQGGAFLYLGQREQITDETPEPIDTALVTVEPPVGAGKYYQLPSKGEGVYQKSTAEDPDITYEPGVTYEFRAALGNTSYVGSVRAPDAERIESLHPPEGYVSHLANEPLTFQRPATDGGTERPIGFVTVLPVGDDGAPGEATYTNIPSRAKQFLSLALSPGGWRTTEVVIPGEAFPEEKRTYLIVFQAAAMGGPKGKNVFSASPFFAATAEIGIVRTR